MYETKFKEGDKAIWHTGPGGQSRIEVTLTEFDPQWGEWAIETPPSYPMRYETVGENELETMS